MRTFAPDQIEWFKSNGFRVLKTRADRLFSGQTYWLTDVRIVKLDYDSDWNKNIQPWFIIIRKMGRKFSCGVHSTLPLDVDVNTLAKEVEFFEQINVGATVGRSFLEGFEES